MTKNTYKRLFSKIFTVYIAVYFTFIPAAPTYADANLDCTVTSYECTKYQDGLCVQQEQNYTCSTPTTCESEWDLGVDYPTPDGNFAAGIMAIQAAENIATHMEISEEGEISFFGGEAATCRAITSSARDRMAAMAVAITAVSSIFPIAGAVILLIESWGLIDTMAGGDGGGGPNYSPSSLIVLSERDYSDCCATNPEDIHTSAGYCKDDHVDLAAARMGARTVFLGKRDTDNSFCWDYTAPTVLTPPTGALFLDGHGGDFFGPKVCKGKLTGIKLADAATAMAMPYGIAATASKIQLDTEQDFCVFDSELSRIIQEQGREQLAKLATKNVAGSVTKNFNFGFYADNGYGWKAGTNINGNQVRFWQWNPLCENEEYRAESLFEDQDCAFDTDVYMAICEQDSCGALPEYPHPNFSAGDWSIFSLEGENHALKALTRYTVVEGGCFDDGGCNYRISGWPSRDGGELRVNADFDWRLRSINNSDDDAMANRWQHVQHSTNQIHYQAYSYPLIPVEGEEVPKPRIRYCVEQLRYSYDEDTKTYVDKCEGKWQEVNVPNKIESPGMEIIAAPKTHLMGGCDDHGLCSYRASTGITVGAKPWTKPTSKSKSIKYGKRLTWKGFKTRRKNVVYDRQNNPQCDGFTMDEFMALDLNKMDFSDYISRLSDEAKAEFYNLLGDLSEGIY